MGVFVYAFHTVHAIVIQQPPLTSPLLYDPPFRYTFLGTSKDVTVGPTAVMSLLVAVQAQVC